MSKSDNAAARKAKVEEIRKRDAAAGKRSSLVFGAVLTVTVAAIAGGTYYGIVTQEKVANSLAPASATTTQGLAVGDEDAPVVVDAYEDFYCGACDSFEAQVGADLAERVEAGAVRVNYHMMSFVRPGASEEAAGAGACAADAGKFAEFHDEFYASSTGEATSSVTGDDLVKLGRDAGIDDPEFAACVTDGKYLRWTDKVDVAAAQAKVNSTPTLFVDGKPVAQGNPKALFAAIDAAVAAGAGDTGQE